MTEQKISLERCVRHVEIKLERVAVGKPRMTQRDKFAPSLAVSRYWAWADYLRLQARQQFLGDPHVGAVGLAVQCWYPPPSWWPKKRKLKAYDGDLQHLQKPDLDNVIKGIVDPLNGILFEDDRQIVRYWSVRKGWARPERKIMVRIEAELY